MNLAIVATTLPFLHRVLASLHTGVLGTTLITEELELSRYGGSRVLQKTAESSVTASSGLKSRRQPARTSQLDAAITLAPPPPAIIHSTIAYDPEYSWNRSAGGTGEGDTESTENLTNAEDSIVQTWEIKIESDT